MSTNQRVLNYHLKRLQNKNRDIRLEAVEELKHLGDPVALEPLQEVFRNDEDVEVRKAAQQAGLVLFKLQQEKDV